MACAHLLSMGPSATCFPGLLVAGQGTFFQSSWKKFPSIFFCFCFWKKCVHSVLFWTSAIGSLMNQGWLRFKQEKLLSIELRQNFYGDRFLNLLVKFVSPSPNTVKLVSVVLLFLFGGHSLVYCHYNPLIFSSVNSKEHWWKLCNKLHL